MSATAVAAWACTRLLAWALAAVALVLNAGCNAYEEVPTDPVLDGRRPIAERPLAATARERAALGGRWLAALVREDGSLPYRYYPSEDRYDTESYNAIRHAGTTYSLFKVAAARSDFVLTAGELATGYIVDHSVPLPGRRGRGYLLDGEVKLGGQALALVALLERRRVTGDRRHDRLIGQMATFLRQFEVPGRTGRMYSRYLAAPRRFALVPVSEYYPGEALLAFTRLAQQFPGGGYRSDARRAARYLVRERDGDIPRLGRVPREDHWLTLALSELYRLDRDPAYARVVDLQAESMIANQATERDGVDAIGASLGQNPINYTSTATKAEALAGAWALALHRGDRRRARRLALAQERTIQFLMRVQYTHENTIDFPKPERAIGAWPQDAYEDYVRIDFVQHNISALSDAAHLIERGDVPLVRPPERRGR
jgi:hypothetical protein